MKLAGGLEDEGVAVGNVYDKYGSRNPIVRRLMRGFERSLDELVAIAAPRSIHEAGCGEGYHALNFMRAGYRVRASDFSGRVIELARANARQAGFEPERFTVRSVYELRPETEGADLLVCCEVLEHLEQPDRALAALRRTAAAHVILSVPREPVWRLMNLARLRYLSRLGNTPGHIQHWSLGSFLDRVSRHMPIIEVRSPLPWTMVLCDARG